MRVLIDACLPVQLKDHIPLPGVRTAREMGWQRKKNGELLALAQQQFDVLLTMDKNLPDQQLLSRFDIGLLIIRAPSNRMGDLVPLVPKIVQFLPLVKKGRALVLSA